MLGPCLHAMTLEATTQLHFLSPGMSSVSSHGKVQWSIPTSHPPLPACSSCHTDYPLGCPLLGFGALNSPNSFPLSNYPFQGCPPLRVSTSPPSREIQNLYLSPEFFSNLTCTFSWQLDLFTSMIHQHLKLNLSSFSSLVSHLCCPLMLSKSPWFRTSK